VNEWGRDKNVTDVIIPTLCTLFNTRATLKFFLGHSSYRKMMKFSIQTMMKCIG